MGGRLARPTRKPCSRPVPSQTSMHRPTPAYLHETGVLCEEDGEHAFVGPGRDVLQEQDLVGRIHRLLCGMDGGWAPLDRWRIANGSRLCDRCDGLCGEAAWKHNESA